MRNADSSNRFLVEGKAGLDHKRKVLGHKTLNLPQSSSSKFSQAKQRSITKTMSTSSNLTQTPVKAEFTKVDLPKPRNLDATMPSSKTIPSVLLPTRRSVIFQKPSGDQKPSATSLVQWRGMNPMYWIEHITTEAEKREAVANGGKVTAPIRVNGVNLSLKRPLHKKLCGVKREAPTETPTTAKLPTESYGLKEEGPQRKRVRVSSSEEDDRSVTTGQGHVEWDFTALLNDEFQPKHPVQNLQTLASTMDSMDNTTPWIKSSYKRIRVHFAMELRRVKQLQITSGQNNNSAVHSSLLRVVYNYTKVKMEALIEMAKSEQTTTESYSPKKVSSAPSPAPNTPVDKKDFANFMSAWLKDNWTNPYPDDDGLFEMATACGTTPTIVSNWLINARTRKWRPAIVKAFELNRPSDLLLEDSLNIFDNHPLRALPEEEPSSDQDDYYQPSNKRAKTMH